MPRGGKRQGSGRPKKNLEIKKERTLNWNAIIYPESAPTNWRDIINETHIEWVESPLHDKDLNDTATKDGNHEEKKPHWHVTLLFPSVKTFEQVKEITDKLNAPIPQRCVTVKGSIRYMVHKDHPDKFQYNWCDIKSHNGVDVDFLCKPTSSEIYENKMRIEKLIDEKGFIEYQSLQKYLRKNSLFDLHYITTNNTIWVNAYLASCRHSSRLPERVIVIKENGEVVSDNVVSRDGV